MKILIMTCGTGGGHNTAAAALEEEMLRRGHQVQVMNPYDLKSARLSHSINQAYIQTVLRCPPFFGALYKIGGLWHRTGIKSPVYLLNRRMAPYLSAHLNASQPDGILMTHFFPGEILTAIRAKGGHVPPALYVATDYTCIPLSDEIDIDAFVIPAPELAAEFRGRGISAERILPLGIPVPRRFADVEEKRAVRERLGMDAGARYILFAEGSMGAGAFHKTLRLLEKYLRRDEDTRLIVVCGGNLKMKRRIERRLSDSFGERIVVLGYTDRMADYLKACDLYITKPGGLSITEAAVTGIPLILVSSIPGCESRNLSFFEGHEMALAVRNQRRELLRAVERLTDPDFAASMISRQRRINPHAAQDICDRAELQIEHARGGAAI